jgi:hypothetical protein
MASSADELAEDQYMLRLKMQKPLALWEEQQAQADEEYKNMKAGVGGLSLIAAVMPKRPGSGASDSAAPAAGSAAPAEPPKPGAPSPSPSPSPPVPARSPPPPAASVGRGSGDGLPSQGSGSVRALASKFK